MEHRLQQVLSAVLGASEDKIGRHTSAETMETWDSLKQMAIIAAVEDEFDIQLDEEQIIHLTSFNALLDAVKEALPGE